MEKYILDYYSLDLLFDRGIIFGLTFIIILLGVVTLNVFDENVNLETKKICLLALFFTVAMFIASGSIIAAKGLVIYFLMSLLAGLLSYYIIIYVLRKETRERIIKRFFK